MDEIARNLADEIVKKLNSIPATTRLLIAIAGFPASGKSTLAILVVNHINALLFNTETVLGEYTTSLPPEAIMVGLDGWHLTRTQLNSMENPELAHARRGAHWTFDGQSYVSFVRQLQAPLYEGMSVITAPSFDHALKDPAPHAVSIHPHHRIVVIEGLYTMLDTEVWRDAAEMMDERWWVEIDWEVAKTRLVKRHVLTGVAKDTVEAIWRADENDGPNGSFVAANLYKPTRVIKSVDDPLYALP
ncbi:P-loop containing nucleoside triphosphate hydrolase protein [Scleroderma yunnanense]